MLKDSRHKKENTVIYVIQCSKDNTQVFHGSYDDTDYDVADDADAYEQECWIIKPYKIILNLMLLSY